MSFVHLHVHSTHSPLDGYSPVEDYFKRAEELGMPGLAITDHGVISAIPEIFESAKKHPTVKPVVGCEFYLTDHFDHRSKGSTKNKCFHLILLAKNETGFRNLCTLCSISRTEGMFINRPRISHKLLEKYHEGLICTSACIGGEIQQYYLNDSEYKSIRAIAWYKKIFGNDFYLEVSSHPSDIPDFDNDLFEKQEFSNAFLFKMAKTHDVELIATNDVHFLSREDGPSQDAAMCKKMNMDFNASERIRFTQQEYFKSENEMLSLFKGREAAITNTVKLLDTVEWYNYDKCLEIYTDSLLDEISSIKAERVEKESETLMGRMDRIVSILLSTDINYNTIFEEERIPDAREDLRFIARKYKITETQAMLFTLMFNATGYEYCSMKDFANSLSITTIKAFSYNEDYEVLRKKWLIRMSPEGKFRIPRMVVNATKRNKVFIKPTFKKMDTAAIIYQIDDFIDYVNQSEYSIEEAVEDSELMLSENPNSGIAKVYEKYNVRSASTKERFLFLFLAHERLYNRKENVSVFSLRQYFKDNEYCAVRNWIHGGCLKMQKKKVIEYDSRDGLATKDHIRFNEDVVKEMCEDAAVLLEEDSPMSGVILPSDITKKELFFQNEVQSNIETLSGLLEESKYNELKRNLRRSGMRVGFTCLFYGAPGTGKTESVYQLAKESGRELLEVDVAALMDCFVGETEKNTRRVFDNYRRTARGNKKAPILLFNEADAILGKRMKGAEKAVDRMGNSVQNIILQEMEKLDGIMIATTNLTENLDPAFERRFLYKIKFENPTKELRSKIWKEMIPSLKEEEAMSLSESYNFSGGQIENIARKRTIAGLLSGKEVTFDQIQTFCSEELLQNKENTKIGFNS